MFHVAGNFQNSAETSVGADTQNHREEDWANTWNEYKQELKYTAMKKKAHLPSME